MRSFEELDNKLETGYIFTYEDVKNLDLVKILEDLLGYNRKEVSEQEKYCDHIPSTLQNKQCPYCNDCDVKEDGCPYCGSGSGGTKSEELGWYDPDKKAVYLCIDRIEKASRDLGCDVSVVKNIVRLHEHIHAYMHQKLQNEYSIIPRYIDEPITEFLTYCICLYFGGQQYLDCFYKLPRLPCYKKWKDIRDTDVFPINIKLIDLLNNLIKDKQLTRDEIIESLFKTIMSMSCAVCTYNINETEDRIKWGDFHNLFKIEFYHEFEITNLRRR